MRRLGSGNIANNIDLFFEDMEIVTIFRQPCTNNVNTYYFK